MTTKGLRHIQIRESIVREAVQRGDITVVLEHTSGSLNLADLFTKEDKDTNHFILIRDIMMDDHNIELIRVGDQRSMLDTSITPSRAQGVSQVRSSSKTLPLTIIS